MLSCSRRMQLAIEMTPIINFIMQFKIRIDELPKGRSNLSDRELPK